MPPPDITRQTPPDRNFVLGFVAGCTLWVMLWMIPIFVFARWRWQSEMDLPLVLAYLAIFIGGWAFEVGRRWLQFRKRVKSGGANQIAVGAGFWSGFRASS